MSAPGRLSTTVSVIGKLLSIGAGVVFIIYGTPLVVGLWEALWGFIGRILYAVLGYY